MIEEGTRAVSVRMDEVRGVAGFILPDAAELGSVELGAFGMVVWHSTVEGASR